MQNTVAAYFGRKGSGKSTLGMRVAADRVRCFVLDTMGEYGKAKGVEVVFGYDACIDRIVQASHEPHFRIALQCEQIEELLALTRLTYTVPDHLILVDEASYYCSPSFLPPELSVLSRYGRHRLIDQIYIARRPSEIHRDLTAACDYVVSFQQREERDVAYLRATWGEEALTVRDLDYDAHELMIFGDRSRAPLPVLELEADRASAIPAAPIAASEPLDAEELEE